MTRGRLIPLVVAAAVAGIAGCGEDEGPQIPPGQSTQLRLQLQEIKRQVAENPCISESSLSQLDQTVASLPEDLDEDVRKSIEDGVERLRELVGEECTNQPEPEEEQTDTEEETTPTETAPTETAPPPTETAPPTETEPEVPEEGGDGLPGDGGPGSGGIGPEGD